MILGLFPAFVHQPCTCRPGLERLAGRGLPHLVAAEGGEEALEVGQGQRSASAAGPWSYGWDFMDYLCC